MLQIDGYQEPFLLREMNMSYVNIGIGFLMATVLSACGGGVGGVSFDLSGVPPGGNDSPAGIWKGTDSDGSQVIALVAEGGGFKLIGDDFNQGFGIIVVTNGNTVSGNYFVAPEFGFALPDGTTRAVCGLGQGTLAERQSITVTVDCATTAGLQHQTTLILSYSALYGRNSSLATIAGNYDDGAGNVLNIAADGTMFEQDVGTSCVTNGQASIILSEFNLYSISLDLSNCMGQDAILNGSTFRGRATLDDTVAPEQLLIAVDGDVGGNIVSIVELVDRL